MRIIVSPEAEKDLENIKERQQKKIVSAIERLENNSIPENSRFIELGDLELFRLKLQEEDRNSDLNHRIFYQIVDSNKIIVRAIFHRQQGYGKKTKNELENRIQKITRLTEK